MQIYMHIYICKYMCSIIYYRNINKDTVYLQFTLLYYSHYILSSNLCSGSSGHPGATCDRL